MESQLHLAEAIRAATQAGLSIENMTTSVNIVHLEHAEEVAQRVFALEARKKKAIMEDIEVLLAPVRCKAELVAQLDKKSCTPAQGFRETITRNRGRRDHRS